MLMKRSVQEACFTTAKIKSNSTDVVQKSKKTVVDGMDQDAVETEHHKNKRTMKDGTQNTQEITKDGVKILKIWKS